MKHLKTYEEIKWKPTHYLLIFDDIINDDVEYGIISKNECSLNDLEKYENEFNFNIEEIEIEKPLKNTNKFFLLITSEDFGDTYYTLADNIKLLNDYIIYNANELQKEENGDSVVKYTNVEDAIKYLNDGASCNVIKIKDKNSNNIIKQILLKIDTDKYNI